jgi:16S rRNA (uracil1498-N3)-methyltransferase
MRIPRFYIADALQLHQQIPLPVTIHRHAIQVLRLQRGAPLILFNGQGGEYECQIQLAEKRQSRVIVQKFNDVTRESSLHITLLQSLIKPDKMDFCIQKSIELGVNAIQPLITERSVVRIKAAQLDKKMQRWQGIISAACEQSGRTTIPAIYAPISLSSYLQKPSNAQRFMMLPEARTKLSTHIAQMDTELLVGPEGGFTDSEVSQCAKYNVEAIQFGARILRAETAALAGLAVLQAYTGNL